LQAAHVHHWQGSLGLYPHALRNFIFMSRCALRPLPNSIYAASQGRQHVSPGAQLGAECLLCGAVAGQLTHKLRQEPCSLAQVAMQHLRSLRTSTQLGAPRR